MDRPSFEQLIKEDRAAREIQALARVLSRVSRPRTRGPQPPELSHARIHDNIMRAGTQDIHESDDPRVKRLYKDESFKVFNFFRDEFFASKRPSRRSSATSTPPH